MNSLNLIPNIFFRRQLGPLLSDNNKSKQLFLSHNIPLSTLSTDGYTEAKKIGALARTVWRLLDDESAGGAAKRLPVGFFNMLCHACSDCNNLKSVIYRTCNFFTLFSDEYNFSLDVKGEEAIFYLDLAKTSCNNKIDNFQTGDYFILSLSIVLLRWLAWLIDESIKLERIEFTYDAFAKIEDFEKIYNSAVEFEQINNRIIFSSDYLDKTIVVPQDKLPSLLINAPHCFLSQYKKSNSTAEKVRKQLLKNENLAQVKISDIALILHCSTATLTRKLKSENTSFMEIKDRARKLRAFSLLKTTDMPIIEISNSLGFSESSAFTRAFKRWTGDCPMEVRNNCST